MLGRAFYDNIADVLANFLPPALRKFSSYTTSHNIKVWFGGSTREHYEVQHIGRQGAKLEIGFHSEHKAQADNDGVVARLRSGESSWRKALGKAPEIGPFIGYQSGSWRRISELWSDVDDPDAAVEAAERLAAYIRAFEPLRTA